MPRVNRQSLYYFHGVRHPAFVNAATRLQTFEKWPVVLRHLSDELVDSGFFYLGQDDSVCCFVCGGCLRNWKLSDDPWEEHAVHYPRCLLVHLVCGTWFVERSKRRQEKRKVLGQRLFALMELIDKTWLTVCQMFSSVRSRALHLLQLECANCSASERELEMLRSKESCLACCSKPRDVVYVPCGHLVSCARCSLHFQRCPVCRRRIDNFVKIYT